PQYAHDSKALKADSNKPPTQQNFPREPVKTERSGVFAGGSRKIFFNKEKEHEIFNAAAENRASGAGCCK
ncbi:MAG: hypothetical protein K2G32_02025, partial [Oscillospiraceae bacterium]|nr:hypothetical protein [Oscillospiraceae bacterium]